MVRRRVRGRTPEPSAMFTTRDLVITDPPGPHLQSR